MENAVGFIRRNLLVPVPQIVDIEAFNTDLLARCHDLGGQDHYRKDHPIARLFDRRSKRVFPCHRWPSLPHGLNPGSLTEGRVKIGGTYYLVDPALHGVRITVGIHPDHIEFFTPTGKPVRILPRDYTHSAITISDPGTLLSLVATRPDLENKALYGHVCLMLSWAGSTPLITTRNVEPYNNLSQTIATGCVRRGHERCHQKGSLIEAMESNKEHSPSSQRR